MPENLKPEEESLLEQFRSVARPQGTLRVSKIWIVQWLAAGERETGAELADWVNNKLRPDWAAFYRCQSKQEVFEALDSAASHAKTVGSSPILHIEAHGNEDGFYPARHGSSAILWNELTQPIQQVNEASGCNLLVIMAACIGNAAVQALTRGPRAPAIALIGPTETILPRALFEASKEGYRVIERGNASLDEIVSGMSSESGTVSFVDHRFTAMAYDVLVSALIKSARPEEKEKRRNAALAHFMNADLSRAQAEKTLQQHPEAFEGIKESQRIWDEMFCIDVCPENQKRFALNMEEIYRAAEAIEANRPSAAA